VNGDKKMEAAIEGTAEAELKAAKAGHTHAASVDNLDDSMKNLKQGYENGAAAGLHWSESLVNGLQTASSFVMGINMMTSAITSLVDSIADGDFSMQTLISSFSSLLMGAVMLAPVLTGAKKAQDALNKTEAWAAVLKEKNTKGLWKAIKA
jgi:hypothetical protein